MIKYWYRKLLFTIFTYIFRAKNKVFKQVTSIENIYISYFRLLKRIRKKYCYKIGDKIVQYDPEVSGIGWLIYFKGSFEKEEQEICSRFLNKESVIFDIGANIGIHSVFYSNIAVDGMVYAFEPARNTYKFLINNIKSISNIIPFNIGLSKETNIFTFYECVNDALSGLKNTLRSNIIQESKVVCFSGDDLFKSLPLSKLDFIKIDVEGLEQEVFEGMKNIITKYMPVIFCEIFAGKNSNESPNYTINFLINLGYSVFIFDNKTLTPFVNHNDKEYNYFFIPRNKLAEFNLQ